MKKLLILGGSEFQIPLVKRAKSKNIYTIVVDINSDAPAFKYADETHIASVKDIDAICEIASMVRPNGITVGMVDIAIPSYAYATSKLGLPGMSIETSKKATDKFEMIKCFEKFEVPHPKFQYISHESVDDFSLNIPYPVIIKPIDMAGSRGIYLVNNDKELKNSIIESSQISDNGNLLVEEYMEGPEVSVEMIVKNGNPYVIQITDKSTSGAPHFAEIGHIQPSQLSNDIKNKIKTVAIAAAKSIGLVNSLAHAELKITNEGPKMVEIGARSGGDGIAEQLIELSTGVSFNEIAIQIAFGEEITFNEKIENKGSCIRFIEAKEGYFSDVSNIEILKEMDGVVDITIYAKKGQYYSGMKDNSGRIGHIITVAEDGTTAEKICNDVLDKIEVYYSKDGN